MLYFFKRLLKTVSTEGEFYLQHMRIGQMRLLNENTGNESSCFLKKFTKHVCAHLSFCEPDILHNNDILQRFTYNEKNRDDFLQYDAINFTSRKNGSNFR